MLRIVYDLQISMCRCQLPFGTTAPQQGQQPWSQQPQPQPQQQQQQQPQQIQPNPTNTQGQMAGAPQQLSNSQGGQPPFGPNLQQGGNPYQNGVSGIQQAGQVGQPGQSSPDPFASIIGAFERIINGFGQTITSFPHTIARILNPPMASNFPQYNN